MDSQKNIVDGWRSAVHQSLAQDPMIGGLKREHAVIIWTSSIFFTVNFWLIHFLLIAGVIHLILAYANRQDELFIDCLFRYLKYKKYYE